MPPNYNETKIYKIWSFFTDEIYIGATTQPLHKILYGHKRDYKKFLNGKKQYISSFEIIKSGSAKIELIDKIKCEDKEELNKAVGEYIRKMDCINKKTLK